MTQATELQAGPELDAEIARRVFGLPVKDLGYYGPPVDPNELWQHDKSVRYDTMEEAREAYRRYWGFYSEDKNRGKAHPDQMSFSYCYWKDGWGPLLVYDYSTDMMDAWLVVEKMREHGFGLIISSPTDPSDTRARFYAENEGVDWNHFIVGSVPAVAPLAICRAALAALEAR